MGVPNRISVIIYGKIVTDEELRDRSGNLIRIRTISYEGDLYYHKMVNGDVVTFRQIGVCER